MSSEPQARLHALDGLRGTMMLLGLVFHGACSYVTTDITKVWPYHDAAQSPAADLLMSFLHAFRMPIFFVLAGFFAAMMLEKRGARGLLTNRFQRIGVPFAVGLLLLFPLTTFAFYFANTAAKAGWGDGWAAVVALTGHATTYLPRITLHLWFLYYLLYFYVGAVAIAALVPRLPHSFRAGGVRAFRALTAQPVLRVALPAVVTAATLAPMGGYLVTGVAFMPDVYVVLAYGLFFAFGWLLYGQRDLLAGFQRFAWTQVCVAAAFYLAVKYLVAPAFGDEPYTGAALVLWSATGGIVAWMMFFGCTGLFLRYCDKPSAVTRYIVDGSYWVYLVHLPMLMTVVGLLSNATLPSELKMAAVILVTTVVGFVSYDLLVRATFIGRVLNGRKYPRLLTLPAIPAGVPTPAGR